MNCVRQICKLASYRRFNASMDFLPKLWVSLAVCLCQIYPNHGLRHICSKPTLVCPTITSHQKVFCPIKNRLRSVHSSEELTLETMELVNAIDKDSAYIVDVRTPSEINEVGHIEAKRWINIPVKRLEGALNLPEEKFKARYGSSKPNKQDPIVFHCMSGVRSTVALNTAINLGFKKAKHYPSGWLGWTKHLKID